MSGVDQTDALVPPGVHVLQRPGITLIPAPVVEPPPAEPAPAPSPAPQKPPPTGSPQQPPTKHATQPSKAPTKAAKTPTQAETATKSTAAAYRPTAFKPSTKAKPNSSLIEAAHRQGGTVAHPVNAAASTKPATTNTKKHQTTPGKTTVVVSAKKPVQTATPTYHTYKQEVHLKPGQTLAYIPGKGYHAKDEAGLHRAPQKHPTQPTKANSSRTPSDRLRARTRTLADASLSSPTTGQNRSRAGRPSPFLGKFLQAIASAAAHATSPHPLADAHAKHPPKQWQSSRGREQYAHKYFATSLGLNNLQAAAIVGNFAVESYAFQRSGKPRLVANLGEYGGGGGYGIAQWTLPQRKEALQDFAREHRVSHANFGLQLAYAAHELATDGESRYGRLIAKGTLAALRNAKSPAEAVAIVLVGFEHSGGQDGQDWRRVPPFPSVVKLAKEFARPNTLLPVATTRTDPSGYRARLEAATRIAHGRQP